MSKYRESQPQTQTTRPLSTQANALPAVPMSATRVLWLRQRHQLSDAARELQETMQAADIQLDIVDAFAVSSQQLAEADLVLLDAFDRMDGIVETTVARVRVENRVPLVMLTDGYSTEQLVTALSAGADAIWALNTPVEVLLARCKALLRRWFLSALE